MRSWPFQPSTCRLPTHILFHSIQTIYSRISNCIRKNTLQDNLNIFKNLVLNYVFILWRTLASLTCPGGKEVWIWNKPLMKEFLRNLFFLGKIGSFQSVFTLKEDCWKVLEKITNFWLIFWTNGIWFVADSRTKCTINYLSKAI